ncbi:MAG TPA: ATP12 family protein [Methyloceanibacter sp.]|nr:ATP12 family protein [Methyloceanibacter sp.]
MDDPGKTSTALPKRFYQRVDVADGDGGFALLLDGKPVRTPGKKQLLLPSRALADAVAGEWRAQKERIDPATMPLTKLANSAIDGVSGREDDVIGDILNYAGSDLLCYRANGPHGLIEAQQALWDPVLAWAASALDAPFVLAEGIVHVAQPGASIDRVRAALKGHDSFGLAALHVMTGLTGSALLALAVARGRMTPDEAWKAAHVDEDWQIAQWGEDAEAASRRSARHRDFAAAAHALALLEA